MIHYAVKFRAFGITFGTVEGKVNLALYTPPAVSAALRLLPADWKQTLVDRQGVFIELVGA